MNKAALISEIANTTKMAKTNISEVIDTFMKVVKNSLQKDEKITLAGFGTFEVRERKATVGVNPQTKEKIKIPAKKVAKLQFSKVINKDLNL